MPGVDGLDLEAGEGAGVFAEDRIDGRRSFALRDDVAMI